MSTFSPAKKAKKDRRRWNSSVRSTIDRLRTMIERKLVVELKSFLSEGFQLEHSLYDDYSDLSVLDYVAGRRFETAEEADEWLTYASMQKNQDFEEESDEYDARALHCACWWGNIFGVKWLVSHGSNFNVPDVYGKTSYSLACKSLIDRSKKMLYLEESGYRFVPSDIVYAAETKFQSSKEADEILHHLVDEKGLSVNAIEEEDEDTPLHSACFDGSIFGVIWLVEHNADINTVNKRGATPFLFACESDIHRSAKVPYLDEKGANCQATDHYGKTALFYAADSAHCEYEEVKDVLRYLAIEKGIDINSVDEEGNTPLLHACSHRSSFVGIEQLIVLGADVSVRNKNKENALHMAAKGYSTADKSIIDLLIEKGVDITCEDKDGSTPHQVTRDGEIRALLRERYDAARFSVLRRETVSPDSIKVCVIGDEMAGKTTFVNSLLQLGRPPPKVEDRTPGVEIHNREIEGVGKGSTWDFGGQPTFHSAHGLFFRQSNTIFILVLRFRDGRTIASEIALLEIGRYWCAFVKSALRTIFSHTRLFLFIIFNLIDFEEEAGIEVSFQLKRVAQTLQEEFVNTFEISCMFEMDCSQTGSLRMNDFRRKLKAIRKQMLEKADVVPKLCHAIERNLCLPDKERKSSLRYFLTLKEFVKWVAEDVGITLNQDERKVSVDYLDSSGLIVNLGNQICLRPLWLCHNVVGPLLAPPYFPFGLPSKKSGEVSLKDIASALKAFENDLKKRGTPSLYTVTVEEATEVLRYLDLCVEVEKSPGTFQIPALLQHSIRRGAWVEDAKFDVYRGQRYECSLSVDIILPSSFVVFQSRCSRMAKRTRREAWKDGVKLVRIVDDKVVESRIELGIKKGHCCIDIILRWSSKRACDEVAKAFSAEIKDMIARICDEKSPGVILNWFYLDSKHLKELDEDPAIYSMADVEKKVQKKTFDHILFSVRPENGQHSSVRDLYILTEKEVSASRREKISLSLNARETRQDNLTKEGADSRIAELSGTFPADDDQVSEDLMKACAAVKGSAWEDLGCLLFSVEEVEDICKSYGGNFVHMVKVLEAWKTAKSPTVGQLLAAFDTVGVNSCQIRKKYGELHRTVFNQSIACSGNLSHEVDLCLVAVNDSEVQAALAVLENATGNTISPPHDHPKKGSTGLGVVTLDIHWPNFFINKEANVRPFRIALITPSSEGREETFQLVTNLFQTALSPSVIAMVGCCAGRKESDVHLGDVMVPFKITRNSGKKLHSGERDANAEYIELDDDLKKMVSVDAKSDKSDWLNLIPENFRATPCPLDLQNSILAELELAERPTKDVDDVHEALLRENDKWDPELITLDVLGEAVQHLVDEGYVVTDKEKGFLWRTEKKCARKSYAGSRQKPKLHTMNVYSGDVVNERIDFRRLAKEVGQAELAGYDMEGYAFFHSVRSNDKRAKAIFVKGVSNFGSKKSRMDYYKKYCAASATAFVCHLLKRRHYLF